MGTPLDTLHPPESGSQYSPRWLLAIAIPLFAVLILCPSIWYPPSRDTALFLQLGDIIARGGMPYRDAWEIKTPAIYLAYSLPAWLGGTLAASWVWVRVFDIALTALAAVLIFRLTIRLLDPKSAFAAALWYCVIYAGSGYLNLAQAESWANPAVIGALYVMWRWRQANTLSTLDGILLGLLTGLVFCFKPTSVLPILAAGAVAAWPSQFRLRSAGFIALGAALPIFGCALWLAANGALEALLDIQRGFVAPYVAFAGASLPAKADFFARRISNQAGMNWLALLLAIGAIFSTSNWRTGAKLFALAAAIGGFAAVWLQNRAFPYHWQTMLPAISILAGAGTGWLVSHMRQRTYAPRWALVALAPVMWHICTRGDRYFLAAQLATGRISRSHWVEQLTGGRSGPTSREIVAVADYVANHSLPDDRLLVWGFENGLNVLANRRSTSRYFLNPGLVSRFAPARWRQEFVTQVTANPPAFLAVLRDDDMRWIGAPHLDGTSTTSSYALMEDWPEFRAFVYGRYHLVRSSFHLNLYQLRPQETAPVS